MERNGGCPWERLFLVAGCGRSHGIREVGAGGRTITVRSGSSVLRLDLREIPVGGDPAWTDQRLGAGVLAFIALAGTAACSSFIPGRAGILAAALGGAGRELRLPVARTSAPERVRGGMSLW